MRKTMLLLAAALVASPAYAQTFDAVAAKARIDASLDKNYPELDALYKDLHSHPEVGFQEERTAALLAAKCANWASPSPSMSARPAWWRSTKTAPARW
jgi:hippurate hydrolase